MFVAAARCRPREMLQHLLVKPSLWSESFNVARRARLFVSQPARELLPPQLLPRRSNVRQVANISRPRWRSARSSIFAKD